jgi:hypothetical protein
LLRWTGQTSLHNLEAAAGVENQTVMLAAFLQGFRAAYLTAAVFFSWARL